MAAKLIFLIVGLFLVAQVLADAPATPDAAAPAGGAAIDFDKISKNVKTFIDDNVKPDKIWESISSNLKDFGDKVASTASEFGSSIQKSINDMKTEKTN